jgi:rsbT co-antagonist protein RsbR
MNDAPSQVLVSRERLQRIIDVLSLVSLGEFDAETVHVAAHSEEDEFALLEETMNILTSELATAHAENSRYVAELQRSQSVLEEKLETIQRQQLAIQDLSTPIIEIWDNILTLPVVGIVDSQRSLDMTERLLNRIVETQSRCVIIDITGVDVVDTMTADHFIKMTRAAKLLGCYCVVTGVSPEIAQTLVRIGINLDGVKTSRSLKDGLKDCFLFLRRRADDEARR